MYEQGPPTSGWQLPADVPGPAPGIQFAPHGERLVAYIIDTIILTVVLFVGVVLIVLVSGAMGAGTAVDFGDLPDQAIPVTPAPLFASGLTILLLLAVFVVSIAYFPWFWARGGQTPGMRPFGLRVVRDRDGGPVGGGQAILGADRVLGQLDRALHRLHLDLHRRPPTRLARSHCRHAGHQGLKGGNMAG